MDSSLISHCHDVHSARTTEQHALMNQHASHVQTITHLCHVNAFQKMTAAQNTAVGSSQVRKECVQYVMMGSIETIVDSVLTVLMVVVSAETMSHAQHAVMTSSFSLQTTHVDHSMNLETSAY